MVRYLTTIFIFFFSGLYAGNFTASIKNHQPAAGKSFVLTATLSDATAKGSPDIAALQKNFIVHSQEQFFNKVIVNGKVSSSVGWKFHLIPRSEGNLTIPAIGIETNQGLLYSKPLPIQVGKVEAKNGNTASEPSFFVTTSISKVDPYKNEPIIYTIKLVSKYDIANISLEEKIKIDDAIVVFAGKPEIVEKIIDGVRMKTLDVKMVITPLKEGPLVIPSSVIHGEILSSDASRQNSFFDDQFDPFQMMRRWGRYEPFATATESTTLNVRPPVPGIRPWLPAVALKIEEVWDSTQALKVGEPLSRSFKISALGLSSSQLPSLKSLQGEGENLKIYADTPETSDGIEDQNTTSSRIEKYTLIPLKSGPLTLPQIDVSWWNVIDNSQKTTTIPSRTLHIVPGAIYPQPVTSDPIHSAEDQTSSEQSAVNRETHPLFYVTIGTLATLLLLAFAWVVALQKKIGRLAETGLAPKNVREPDQRFSFKELHTATSAREIYEFLQSYAHSRWNTHKNATIHEVCQAIKEHTPPIFHNDLLSVEKSLENALYRHLNVEVLSLAMHCCNLLEKTTIKQNKPPKGSEKLPQLNPR